jgi:hypothetical protein
MFFYLFSLKRKYYIIISYQYYITLFLFITIIIIIIMSFEKKIFPNGYNRFINENDCLTFDEIFNKLDYFLTNNINIKKKYINKTDLNNFFKYITKLFKDKAEETKSEIINDYYNNVKSSIRCILNAPNGYIDTTRYTNKNKIFFVFSEMFNGLEPFK